MEVGKTILVANDTGSNVEIFPSFSKNKKEKRLNIKISDYVFIGIRNNHILKQ